MVCTDFSSISGIADMLVWPTGCFYYFWLVIFLSIFGVITWVLLKSQEERESKGDMISSAAIASIAVTVIASFGTLVKNSSDIPMIQTDILLYLLAITISLVMLWIFSKD